MKIYLLITTLLFIQALSYRYSNTQPLYLPTTPINISYLAPNVIAIQNGKSIYVYNTLTDTVQQTFDSDSDNPTPQVAGQLNMLLFKNNNTLFQLQPSDGPVIVKKAQPGNEWIYPLGLESNTIIYHSLDIVKANRWITYIQIQNGGYVTRDFPFTDPGENILRGSGVETISPTQYYFVSGGICNTKTQVLFFFRGNETGISNVFNLTIPGCNMPDTTTKQTFGLASIDQGNEDRIHAVTYQLDATANPFMYSTQIINQVNGTYEELIRFDTFNLLGIEYFGSTLFTADGELCRVLQHYPDSYKKSFSYSSVLPKTVTDTAVSAQNLQIAVFNGTNTFSIFKLNGFSGKIFQQLYRNPLSGTATFTDGDYYGSNLWIVRDSSTSKLLTVYLEYTPNKTTSSVKDMNYTVFDYCSTNNQVFYSVQVAGNVYTLNKNTIVNSGDINNRTINTAFSTTLPVPVKSIKCLDASTVLIIPVNQGDSFTTWQANDTAFTNIGSLPKDNIVHNQVHTTANAIIFLNANYQMMLVFDFSFVLITNSIQPILPPDAAYLIASSSGNNIVFAIAARGELTQPDSLDHYTLIGQNLSYVGSYPLYGTTNVDFSKILLITDIGRLSVDYGNQTVSFDVNFPPQSLRGYFYDTALMDCRGYDHALFKPNPIPDIYDMVILNAENDVPIIQRYTFTQKTVSVLTQTASVTLNNYLKAQMNMILSSDRLKVLVYGIKQTTQTDLITVQVKNANNLDTLFEKEFVDITSQDKVQAYGQYKSQFVSAVTYEMFFIGARFYRLDLGLDVNSLGKISTDSSIGTIDLFSTCSRCSFTAVATFNTKLIQLISLTTGVNRANITVSCTLKQIALSPDGNRVAYVCQNNGFYAYDSVLDQTYFLSGSYTQITSLYFLSNQVLIVINNGEVVQLELAPSGSSNLMDNSKLIRQSLASIQVQYVAINYILKIYAYISDLQTVQIYDYQGTSIGLFVLSDSNQNIVGIAFDPSNQLIVTTNASNLITLSTSNCPTNATIDSSNGYCICQPTFASVNSICMCSQPLYLDGNSCACGDGSYYVSEIQCGDCNVMCHTCNGQGVGNCINYSALFIIIIVASVLIVLGLFILFYIKKIRKGKGETRLQSIQRSASTKKKSVSSDALIERLVEKNEEERMRPEV